MYCSLFIKEIEVTGNCCMERDGSGVCVHLVQSLKYYRQMIAILPALVFDGLVLGFVSSAASKLMPKDSERVDVGVFLIVMGMGCVTGGYFSGFLSDSIHMVNAGKLAVIQVLIMAVLTAFIGRFENIGLVMVCGYGWGLAREFLEGWLYVACSRNYNGQLYSYANMKQLHSLSFCCYMLVLATTAL
jgi:hypothetical protein